MEDFNEKYNDLLNRGYEISFYENENYNLFTQNPETVYYVSIKKEGTELFHFPSRLSYKTAFLNAYNLVPKVEKLLN
jgi:hypothetical protein